MAMPAEGLPEDIRSPDAHDRRRAVRDLRELSDAQIAELRTLRASEPDAWVRRGMDRILSGQRAQLTDIKDEVFVDAATAQEIREQARVEIAELVVHELRHSLLHIELAAEQEIDGFATSETKKKVANFRAIGDSLSQLADSSRGAQPVEVALDEVVAQTAADFMQTLWPPDLIGQRDTVVRVDPGMLRLALGNCLRNAIDASQTAAHVADRVRVTWGRTDRDAWVAIHDDGVGLPDDVDRLFEPHHTTKGGSGNSGLGLTIASNAMRSMGGEVLLRQRDPRGTVCELRWPQGEP